MKCQMILFWCCTKKKKKNTAVPALYSIDSGWQQFWTPGTSQLITTSPQGTWGGVGVLQASLKEERKKNNHKRRKRRKKFLTSRPLITGKCSLSSRLCKSTLMIMQRPKNAWSANSWPGLTEDHGESSDLSNVFGNYWYMSTVRVCIRG